MRLALMGILLVLAVLCLSSYALDVIQADVKLEPSSVALESNIEAIPVNEVQFHVGGFKLKEVPSNKRGYMLDLQNAEVEPRSRLTRCGPDHEFRRDGHKQAFCSYRGFGFQSLEIIQNLPVLPILTSSRETFGSGSLESTLWTCTRNCFRSLIVGW